MPSSPLCAYGKLPLSREFLRLECERGAARMFRGFLDQGARVCAEPLALDLPPRRLVMTLPGGAGEMVVASLWRGADEGGRRPYPFSFFATLGADAVADRHPGFWSNLAPLFRVHDGALSEARTLSDAPSFMRLFSRRMGGQVGAGGVAEVAPETDPPCEAGDGQGAECGTDAEQLAGSATDAPPATQPSSESLASWLTELFGDSEEQLVASLFRLKRLADPARGRLVELSRSVSALRVPLSKTAPRAPQVDAWLGSLAGPEGVLGAPANMLLSRSGEDRPTLTVFLRPLMPQDLGLLVQRPIPGLVDLTVYRPPTDLGGFGAFSERVLAAMADGASVTALPELMRSE